MGKGGRSFGLESCGKGRTFRPGSLLRIRRDGMGGGDGMGGWVGVQDRVRVWVWVGFNGLDGRAGLGSVGMGVGWGT